MHSRSGFIFVLLFWKLKSSSCELEEGSDSWDLTADKPDTKDNARFDEDECPAKKRFLFP